MRILVAEANSDLQQWLCRVLSGAGHKLDCTGDGREAIDLYRRHRHSLVVYGRGLAHLDGPDLARTIRVESGRGTVYLVFLNHCDAVAGQRLKAGGSRDACLWLPCPDSELLERIESGRRVLALRQAFWNSRRQLDQARQEAGKLFSRVFPDAIARRLSGNRGPIADNVAAATVMSAGLHDFQRLVAENPPLQVVELLDRLFCRFDEVSNHFGVERIKTDEGAYLAAAGVLTSVEDHAERVAAMALALQREIREIAWRGVGELRLQIGIDSGSLVSGVVGSDRLSYDLWGDPVHSVKELKTSCPPGAIQVGEGCAAILPPSFLLEERGEYFLPGSGTFTTYLLCGRKDAL